MSRSHPCDEAMKKEWAQPMWGDEPQLEAFRERLKVLLEALSRTSTRR